MSKLPSRKKSFDVVGETRPSRDGTSRQLLLLRCEPGDPIALERQPDNEHDPNAILVVWEGHDLGFLAKEDAEAIAPPLDQGRAYKANIHKLTGGSADYPSYGLKVAVAWDDAPLPDARCCCTQWELWLLIRTGRADWRVWLRKIRLRTSPPWVSRTIGGSALYGRRFAPVS